MSDQPMPKRIQMSRQRPWLAENPDAVIVARPSVWGNPFRLGVNALSVEQAVEMFRDLVTTSGSTWGHFRNTVRVELGGRDLACWCALDAPCHADVLLELANPKPHDSERSTE